MKCFSSALFLLLSFSVASEVQAKALETPRELKMHHHDAGMHDHHHEHDGHEDDGHHRGRNSKRGKRDHRSGHHGKHSKRHSKRHHPFDAFGNVEKVGLDQLKKTIHDLSGSSFSDSESWSESSSLSSSSSFSSSSTTPRSFSEEEPSFKTMSSIEDETIDEEPMEPILVGEIAVARQETEVKPLLRGSN